MSKNDDQFDDIATEFITEEDDSRALRWLSLVVVFIAIAGFFGLAWYAYNAGVQGDDGNIEVVAADDTPIREVPQDPGGQIPHQDKTIYNEISPNPAVEGTERILPAPEEPASTNPDTQSQNFDGQASPSAASPVEKPAETPVVSGAVTPSSLPDKTIPPVGEILMTQSPKETPKELAKDAAPVAAAETPAKPASTETAKETPAPAPVEKPMAAAAKEEPKVAEVKSVEVKSVEVKTEAKPEEKKVADAKPTEEKKPVESTATGKARAQLGAYKSDIEAKQAWVGLAKKHSELSNKSYDVVRADLGSKGVYYRLQVIKLDPSSAKSLCDALSARKQACMVVK